MNEIISDQLNDIENLQKASNTACWDCGGIILQLICRFGKDRRSAAKEIGIPFKRLTRMINGDCTIPLSEYLTAAHSLNAKIPQQ